MTPYLSIVSPMYNEEKGIRNFIETIKEKFSNYPRKWELIVVDDGSKDKSLEVAKEAVAQDDNIKVISLGRHYGRGKALRRGIAEANGTYIITIESDLSWRTDDIFKVVETLEKNEADVVLVSPYRKGGGVKGVPLFRLIISWLGNKILGASFGGDFSMVTQMFRGYKADIVKSLEFTSDGKEIHLEILSKLRALGYKAKEIPGILSKRGEGSSKFKLRHTAWTHLIFSVLERPLLFFGLIGGIFLLAGIALGIYIIVLWATQSLNPVRPIMTLFVVLLLAGAQMFSFGLIGLLLVNLRKELLRLQSKSQK